MLQYGFSQYLYFDTKKGLKALKSSGLYEASNLVEHNLWLQIPPIENEGLFIIVHLITNYGGGGRS